MYRLQGSQPSYKLSTMYHTPQKQPRTREDTGHSNSLSGEPVPQLQRVLYSAIFQRKYRSKCGLKFKHSYHMDVRANIGSTGSRQRYLREWVGWKWYIGELRNSITVNQRLLRATHHPIIGANGVGPILRSLK